MALIGVDVKVDDIWRDTMQSVVRCDGAPEVALLWLEATRMTGRTLLFHTALHLLLMDGISFRMDLFAHLFKGTTSRLYSVWLPCGYDLNPDAFCGLNCTWFGGDSTAASIRITTSLQPHRHHKHFAFQRSHEVGSFSFLSFSACKDVWWCAWVMWWIVLVECEDDFGLMQYGRGSRVPSRREHNGGILYGRGVARKQTKSPIALAEGLCTDCSINSGDWDCCCSWLSPNLIMQVVRCSIWADYGDQEEHLYRLYLSFDIAMEAECSFARRHANCTHNVRLIQ